MRYLVLISFFLFRISYGQEPAFNPMLKLYNLNSINEVFSSLNRSKFFVGRVSNDSIITGKYQNQEIKVMILNQHLDIQMFFNDNKSYLNFLKAARIFFVIDNYPQPSSLSQNCQIQNFTKPDFKTIPLAIYFAHCSNLKRIKDRYSMRISPGRFYCGNKF